MASVPRPLTDVQQGFSGGWNLSLNGQLGPEQYRSPSNVRISNDGDLMPRQGTRKAHTSAVNSGAAIVNGFSWRRANGTVTELMVSSDGSVWKGTYSDATGQPVLSSITSIASAGTISGAGSFVSFRDLAGNEKVYIADGQNHISYYDGTTFGNHTVGPAGVALAFIWLYNHRLFGVTGSNEIIYFSALEDGDSLGVIASSGGFLTVRTFGGQQVTGGLAVGATNELFHNGALSMFRGLTSDDIAIDTGSMGISAIAGLPYPRAAVVNDAVAFLLTSIGSAVLFGATLQLLDQPNRQDPLISDPAYPTGFLSAAQGVSGTPFAIRNTRMKEIWFGSTGATGLPVYAWSYRYGCWVGKYDFHSTGASKPIRSIWETRTPSGAPQLLYGSSDGFVRTLDCAEGSSLEVYLDDVAQDGTGGSAYTWSAQCRRFWASTPRLHKAWRSVSLLARLNSGSCKLTATGQKGDTNNITFTQTSTLQTGDYGTYRTTTLPKTGQYLDISVSHTTAAGAPRLNAIDIEADPIGDRGV